MLKDTKLLLLFLGLLIVGIAGFFTFRNTITGLISAHLGALGLIGIFACIAGFIARKKGLNYWRAIAITIVSPIVMGFVFVLAIYFFGKESQQLICGGSVSLAIAILICISYLFAKTKIVGRQA